MEHLELSEDKIWYIIKQLYFFNTRKKRELV